MARTPTIYRYDDPDAPDLNMIMPSTADKQKLLMHTVLKACLVTGYGEKEAAGWTMPHEEITNKGCRFVLTNKANSGSLLYEGGIFSGGAGWLEVDTLWACSSVPLMDTPVNAWSNGVAYGERLNGASSFHKSAIRSGQSMNAWCVIANENTVIVTFGVESVDFSISSSSAPDGLKSAQLIFGVMHDGDDGVSGAHPGNFYIAGGGSNKYEYNPSNAGLSSSVFSSNTDILKMPKSQRHNYKYAKASAATTYSPLSAWLPMPIIYHQYGPSAPDGNSSNRLHFAAALPGLKKLLLRPINTAVLNEFMVGNNAEYGKVFTFHGAQWVLFKSIDDVVSIVSLDSSEWGV